MEIRGEFFVRGVSDVRVVREFRESREFSEKVVKFPNFINFSKNLSSFVFRLSSFYYLCKAKDNFMIQAEHLP